MADLRDAKRMASFRPDVEQRLAVQDANTDVMSAAGASDFSRGWTTAGLSETANALMTSAAKAYNDGDAKAGQALEAEGLRTMKQAATWAPSVQNFTDIDSAGAAGKWAAGALGNVRSSIMPTVGGVAGGLAGAALTRSAKGAQLGSMLGSGLAGYDQMADETIGTAMADPSIRASKGYDQILNTGRVSGAVQAPLEGLVPGLMGAAVVGAGKQAAKAGIKATMAKAVGGGAAGEFGTEFAQDLVGQAAQNSLKDRGLADDLNYQQALNAGAAGAVAGGVLGGIGGVAQLGHQGAGAAGEVADVVTDPRKMLNAAAAGAGKLAGQAKNVVSDKLHGLDDYISGLNIDPDRRRLTGAPGGFADEAGLEGADIHALRKPFADRMAAKILDPQSTASPEERQAATNYAQHGDPFTFGDELVIADGENKLKTQETEIADELNGTTKKSKMKVKRFGDIDYEVPASSIPESGSPPVTGRVKNDNTPEFTDRAPASPDLMDAKRQQGAKEGKKFFEDIPILADIWRKQGVDEGIINNVSQNVEPAQRQSAVAIMSWVARDFRDADGEVLVPESLIKSYGKGATKLVENAYNLAVQQGVIDPASSEATYKDVVKKVGDLSKRYETDANAVFDALTPIAKSKFQATLESDSRGEFMSKLAPIATALRKVANGEISAEQDKALDTWFGPRKNEILDHFYEEQSKPVYNEGESGLSEDDTRYQREEQGLSASTEHGFTQVKDESYYQHRDKAAGAAGEYFDLTNEDHRNQLRELQAGRVADAKAEGDQPSLRTMSTVGMVDREIEKRQHQKALDAAGKRVAVRDFARSLGKTEAEFTPEELEKAKSLPPSELTASEKRKALADAPALHPNEAGKIRREIAERELGIKAPAVPPKGAGPEQIRAYERELRDHERTVDRQLASLNKNRVAVRVTKSDMPSDLGFTKQDVTELRLKELNLRAARALVTNGVLVFDNGSKSGNYYATTARKIIAHVISKNSDAGFTGSLEEPGQKVRLYRMLQDGVTSLMQAGEFSRVGYIDRITPRDQTVKPVWIVLGKQTPGMKKGDQNFPDVLPLGKDFRVADARYQQSVYDAEQERLSGPERAILKSEGKAQAWLLAKRVSSFILDDKSLKRLGKGASERKTQHEIAAKAVAEYQDSKNPSVLKAALKALTGSGELHYSDREAGLLVQIGLNTLSNKQVAYLRSLKTDLGRAPTDKRFLEARSRALDFFKNDTRNAGLKEGTEDAIDWRERAIDAINSKLTNSRLASAASEDFHADGDIEGLRDTLYKITGDEQYITSTVPSEQGATGGPDDEIKEYGTLREDPSRTVGTKNSAIERDEHGNVKGDPEFVAGMMTGAGDSTRVVKDAKDGTRTVKTGVQGRVDPASATIAKKEPGQGTIPFDTVVQWLRASSGNTMRNITEQIENGRLDAAQDALDYIEELSNMTPAQAATLANDLDAGKAARLIERAKNVLPRARAIVDAEGGVNVDERRVENGPQEKVGKGGPGSVRDVVNEAAGERAGGERSDRAAAGEVRSADKLSDWINKASRADVAALRHVITKMTEAQINKALDRIESKEFLKNDELDADDMARLSRLYDALVEQLPENKQSKVKASAPEGSEEAAREHLTRVLGDKIKVKFIKAFRDGTSGEWRKGADVNSIRIALNADVLGAAYHESIHEFFDILGKHGGEKVRFFMKWAAGNKRIQNRLSQLLDGQPDAQAQLADPEEALAYMYQFWKMGQLNIGPETKSWFQKISDYIRGVLGMVTDEMKAEQDLLQAEFVLAAFDSGRFARDDEGRTKLVAKLNAHLEAHNKALENVGSSVNALINTAGKYVLSAESVVENAKNKYMIDELRLWNQKTGTAMGERASFFEAVAFKRNQYANRLENLLHGKDKEDIELARKGLSTNVEPTHPAAKEVFDGIRQLQADLFEYAQRKKVARLDPETGEWIGIKKRKDYYPQVWDVETLMKNGEAFKALLLEKHTAEMTSIAEKANRELATGVNAGDNTASALAKKGETITVEMVADAILRRVLNSGGHVELDESISSLGMSPVAAAVNKRELSWIDAEAFDEFKSKDLVKVMTSYISSMVKRAEHTDRFGHGGEKTRERADKAFLFEVGGDDLVEGAAKALPKVIDAWREAKSKDKDFDEPYPTLRNVGEKKFASEFGDEILKEARTKAVEKLEDSYKAVMAMEGTLGADVSENVRALNSWMMTYQNFRLLSTTLFSSFADVVGLVVNGGEVGDAWDAFVTGIKEVKLGWGDKKSNDFKAQRAELWGTVDAGSTLDALGQTYGSSFMTGAAKRMSDSLFKWNGMEAWNRAMRITATSVAERVIKQYQSEGYDSTDAAAKARFEELFGEGFDPKDIKLDADGNLDLDDIKNQAAVSKWVNGAILRPNAAQRTIWGSDPHYQMLWHMKQFAYTFQSVILAKAVEQAKLGNYRPALAAMAGYVPVIIAADAIKELLIPGDEPAWMKSGLAGMLQHGVDRAGLLGIGQMGYDAFATDFGAGLTGPAISQVLHVPFDDPSKTALRALPFGNLAGRLAY